MVERLLPVDVAPQLPEVVSHARLKRLPGTRPASGAPLLLFLGRAILEPNGAAQPIEISAGQNAAWHPAEEK
jgi:hypothetical protein